ncbi:alpha-1,3-arabinosyltransferase XAT3-like isoform X2 [Phragmites australis]|uniref:alpha-1,3-arabinosyltransferase XAT3-like isoform X2 n=1 Tax=Phragmites australis TaxID=29695 RepID=UPI002D7A211D|nr:alpha-1,3-arabinosyltransferase XAT3-like isoform X2 [Phragmites australis]
MKSNRNLSRGEGRRLGNVALIAFMLGSLLLLSLVRARFSPIGKTGEAIKAEEQQAMRKESVKMETLDTADDGAASAAEEEEEETQLKPTDTSGSGGVSRSSVAVADAATDHLVLRKPVCYETSRRSDTCEAAGDVRVQGRTQTIHISPLEQEWKVKPYCRKHDAFALSHVKEWALRPLSGDAPHCTINSSATAFVLSTGGFTGNLFHDYTDVLIPAFITAHRYAGELQFLVSSFKSWWTNKYLQIFQQLSNHEVVDIDNDDEVRCYRSVVVGPTFHKELGVDASKTPSGYSMVDFRAMLRGAFGLERATATPSGDQWDIRRRPRLLIISRRSSRRFLNERAMVDMAMSLGFDVRVGDPDISTDVSKFARLVNSADVMVGVHGAGLTNMVFLPAGAVLIQVVPYGGLEWLARGTFKEPSADMQIHYLDYMIQLDETTLSEQYPKDDPVLKDPSTIHKQGWNALKTVYLDKQDVRPHLGRLKNTFTEALKLLPHGQSN